MEVKVTANWEAYKESGKLYDSGTVCLDVRAIVVENVITGVLMYDAVEKFKASEAGHWVDKGYTVRLDISQLGYPVLIPPGKAL